MLRLVELVSSHPEKYSKDYPVELAELYRELCIFDESISRLKNLIEENHDRVTDLLLIFSIKKTTAPIRYKH